MIEELLSFLFWWRNQEEEEEQCQEDGILKKRERTFKED